MLAPLTTIDTNQISRNIKHSTADCGLTYSRTTNNQDAEFWTLAKDIRRRGNDFFAGIDVLLRPIFERLVSSAIVIVAPERSRHDVWNQFYSMAIWRNFNGLT